MDEHIENGQNQNYGVEIPEFIGMLNQFTRTLDDEVRIENLFDPPEGPKNPPQGWLLELVKLEPNQKALLNATLGAAKVNEFETIHSIRDLSIEEIIAKSASLSSTLHNFRTIGLKRATILKQLFEKNTADVKNS